MIFNVHNGTVHLCRIENNSDPFHAIIYEEDHVLNLPCLPFKQVIFKSEEELIGGGFDGKPASMKIVDGKLIY